MERNKSALLRWANVGVAAAVALVGTGAFVSAHGGDGTRIHACLNPGSGTIFVVGANETCGPNQTPLDWNIQGPAGLPGPQGAQGPQGPTGPQGPQGPAGGISGYERVIVTSASNSDDTKGATAVCPAGKVIVSGGAQIALGTLSAPTSDLALHSSYPTGDFGWTAGAFETDPYEDNWHLILVAICANVTP